MEWLDSGEIAKDIVIRIRVRPTPTGQLHFIFDSGVCTIVVVAVAVVGVEQVQHYATR